MSMLYFRRVALVTLLVGLPAYLSGCGSQGANGGTDARDTAPLDSGATDSSGLGGHDGASNDVATGNDSTGGADANGADASAEVGADASSNDASDDGGGASDGGMNDGATVDSLPAVVTVTLGETSFVFDTPDLTHTFTSTVTGTPTTSVTWSSSNTYVATVSSTGVVTSVSGGQAIITATSTADSTKTATATVSVAEPDRPRALTYIDATTITSGPIGIIMCGDSLTRTYLPNAADQAGWGQVLDQFLGSEATVDNTIANGGRSSRSFYNEVGRWDVARTRLAQAKTAGIPTFVFIMFGHNDQKKLTDTNGADYLTFASQNPNGTVAGTFYDYLERYVVEARELGGIPVLFTPFVREYLQGSPATLTATGQHNITVPYAGEAAARGDYPAAVKAVAAKHDVPVVDITEWSKTLVEARAAAGTLDYVYISSDQTHVRTLGALLMAQEAMRALNAQGILTSYTRTPAARVMLDANTLGFGGIYAGNTADEPFRITPFGDVTGTLTLTAPAGYAVSTDGTTFSSQLTVTADASWAGNLVTVRFAPTDAAAYNADLTVAHTSITPDYGNTVPNPAAGAVSLTGNGKALVTGSPATATWPMFSGTTIVMTATTDGAINASTASLVGLVNKNVSFGGARFDVPSGSWPAESARNPGRYVELSVPVTVGTFTLDTISLAAGSSGGSNMKWDVVYSLTPDFSSPTVLGSALGSTKDTLSTSSYPSLGVSVATGQTLYLRVYPYNTSAATGKSLMLANVVISGVTN